MASPPPAALARLGLITLSDNVPAGGAVDVGGAFVELFRQQLQERFLRQGLLPCEHTASSSCSRSE